MRRPGQNARDDRRALSAHGAIDRGHLGDAGLDGRREFAREGSFDRLHVVRSPSRAVDHLELGPSRGTLDEPVGAHRLGLEPEDRAIRDIEEEAGGERSAIRQQEPVVAPPDEVGQQPRSAAARAALVEDARPVALAIPDEGHGPVVELGPDDVADIARRPALVVNDLHLHDVLVHVVPTGRALRRDPSELLGAVLVAHRRTHH